MRKIIFTLIFAGIIVVPILAEPISAKGERARAAVMDWTVRLPGAADTDLKKFTFCSELKEALRTVHNNLRTQIAQDRIIEKINRVDVCLNTYASWTEVSPGMFQKQKWIEGSRVWNPDPDNDIYRSGQ